MTSFAFILGVMPLVFATGAGANARRALGTGVVGGMLSAAIWACCWRRCSTWQSGVWWATNSRVQPERELNGLSFRSGGT
jgi:hypothetical protein